MKMKTIEGIVENAGYTFELEWYDESSAVVSGEWIVDGDRRHVEYSICDLYRDAGGEYPCEPCEGGLMVFSDEIERGTWLMQK